MKLKRMRSAGFTLVEIMIVVAIIGLLAAIAVPNFVKARNTAQSNACINNMRQIDSAVQQWALEKGKKDTDAVVAAEVAEYIKGNAIPKCPAGGDYDMPDTVLETVKCPNATAAGLHTLGPAAGP